MAEVDQSSRMISQLTQVEQKSLFQSNLKPPFQLCTSLYFPSYLEPTFQGSRPSQSSIPEEDDAEEEWFDN